MNVKLVLAITSPTAFLEINSLPSLVRALQSLRLIESILPISVAVDSNDSAQVRDLWKDGIADIEVLDCDLKMPRSFAEALAPSCIDADAVLIHDASRPLTSRAQFDAVFSAFTDETDAVRPAMSFTETLKILDANSVITRTLDRTSVHRISTPELIRVSAIDFTGPECGWFLPLRNGARVLHIEGSPDGLRINSVEDRDLMELSTD